MKQQTAVLSQGLNLEVTSSERSLLAYFLAKLLKIDPDVLIVSSFLFSKCGDVNRPVLSQGHNISSQWLDLLQHRVLACKVPQWSRIGRIKRTALPKVVQAPVWAWPCSCQLRSVPRAKAAASGYAADGWYVMSRSQPRS